ncbi:MAG: TIGR01777 family oxidoreductase [Kordiimonadaceae bacterium]|nr:TIGR01777 family oxidoreductase [Kordiimonadaceae bacterium]MBO6568864.1 TIGR01777 family oxidoreductase [Kordiimonadaceae bacterium]MBO6965161.1 TIGR01777 family oxidoreductase [Kordiimonadaceae bacterium]
MSDQQPKNKIWLITGGSGFIGRALVSKLKKAGNGIFVLSRTRNKTQITLGRHVKVIESLDEIPSEQRIDVVVNLAGEPLFGGLWTEKRKQRFFDSRLSTTAKLIELLKRLDKKPSVMISGSAIGFYGMHPSIDFHECADPGSDEMARLCQEWESAAHPAEEMGVRLVLLRIGLVLDKSGGMLGPLMLSSKLGLGSRLGTGKQWMSWITREDLVRMIVFAAEHPAVKGPINGTAPKPVQQIDFANALAKHVKRPRLLWTPAAPLKLVLGDMAALLLNGQKVLPRKAIDMGFAFNASQIEDAFG